jgi:predicted nucleic acid-binding protein
MRNEAAFWDSSALVPLLCHQDSSSLARVLARRYGRMVVWWGSRVEVLSALVRLRREGRLSETGLRETTARLSVLSQACLEVTPTESVRERAEQLLVRHPIRAADSLQLAAAFVWCHGHPQQRNFVCFDGRLGNVAAQAGFNVEGVADL